MEAVHGHKPLTDAAAEFLEATIWSFQLYILNCSVQLLLNLWKMPWLQKMNMSLLEESSQQFYIGFSPSSWRLSPLPIKGVGCDPPWEATGGFKLPRKHQILEASNCSMARDLRTTGHKAGKQGSCCVLWTTHGGLDQEGDWKANTNGCCMGYLNTR